MKKLMHLMFLLIVTAIAVSSCTKDAFDSIGPVKPGGKDPMLMIRQPGGLAAKMIASNMAIYGVANIYTIVWDSAGQLLTFVLEDSARTTIIYQSPVPENMTDFGKKLVAGTYWLTATKTGYIASNIKIVLSGTTPPPAPSTSPVDIKGMHLSGTNVIIDFGVNKSELNGITGTGNWFYVSRVNGQNFAYGAVTSTVGDSVFYSITIPQTNNTVLEFNDGKYNSSNQAVWQVASSTSYNCVLYANTGENYWQLKLTLNSTTAKLWAPNNTLVYQIYTMNIPGIMGDDSNTNFTVRLDGSNIYYRDLAVNADFRWRVGSSGGWNYMSAGIWNQNTQFRQITWQAGASGDVQSQWGIFISGVFTPAGNISQSKYYDAALGVIRFNR